MSYTREEQVEEQIYLANIAITFRRYEQYSISANNRRRKDFFRLRPEDRDLLESIGWKDKLDQVDEAIQANARFLQNLMGNAEVLERSIAFMNEEEEMEMEKFQQSLLDDSQADAPPANERITKHGYSGSSHTHNRGRTFVTRARSRVTRSGPTDADIDKLRSTLKQLVRDWGEEGKSERDACYSPMTEALLKYYSHVPESERRNYHVLVPGAGLGRLAFDVARLGFTCQGNEFSHYMLLASFFILNRTKTLNEHTIYPYIHSFSNTISSSTMLRPIMIPDVLPSDLPPDSNFSLVAGDFEEIYGAQENNRRGHESQVGKWDAVLTCFFIDTAKNVIHYLRIIHRILKPGGVWINLGPLLWHYENNASGDTSIEVDLEEMKTLADKIGFDIQQERVIETTYTSDKKSMLGYIYRAQFWIATKKQLEPEGEKPNSD